MCRSCVGRHTASPVWGSALLQRPGQWPLTRRRQVAVCTRPFPAVLSLAGGAAGPTAQQSTRLRRELEGPASCPALPAPVFICMSPSESQPSRPDADTFPSVFLVAFLPVPLTCRLLSVCSVLRGLPRLCVGLPARLFSHGNTRAGRRRAASHGARIPRKTPCLGHE